MKNKTKLYYVLNLIIAVAMIFMTRSAAIKAAPSNVNTASSAAIMAAPSIALTAETDVESNVSIAASEKGRPQIGQALTAVITDEEAGEDEQFVYSWLVGGTEVSTEKYYVPTEADLEKWIVVNVYVPAGFEHDNDNAINNDNDNAIDNVNGSKDENTNHDGLILYGRNQIFFSKLPVVYINTDDGKKITKKEDYEGASMNIQGNEKFGVQYKESDRIQIKIRGNVSALYPQKPYKIKLEKKSDLFGMGKNKHWVLLSNYLDECCLRNTTASKLAKKLGVDAMDMQWVDVVFNGVYNGTYILSEHIRVDKTRINIKDWEEIAEDAAADIYAANKDTLEPDDLSALEDYMKENLEWITTDEIEYNSHTYRVSDFYADYSKKCSDISGGYLFEMSKEYDEVSQFKTEKEMPVMLNKPEYLCSNQAMFEYVMNLWQDYENAAVSINGYNLKGESLYDIADIDSMAAYWLVMEIMGNDDAKEKSRYSYLDVGGKLTFGPVWDFDWGSASRSICDVDEDVSEGWIVSRGVMWKDWVDDPYFLAKAREKYLMIRAYLEEMIREGGVIESDYSYIRESGNALYDYIVKSGWADWSVNCKRPSRGFERDYACFYGYLKKRIAWLDEQFKDLDTLVTSLSDIGRNKYSKSKDLKLGINNKDGKTNICVGENDPINLNINDNVDNIACVEIFVNGKKAGSYYFEKKSCNVELNLDLFETNADSQNVVSVIAFYSGKKVKTDYCVVTFGNEEEPSGQQEESTKPSGEQEESTQSSEQQEESTKPSGHQSENRKTVLGQVKIKRCIKNRKKLMVSLSRMKNAKGYKVYIYKSKRDAKANKKAVLTKLSPKTKITVKLKKKILKKAKYVRVRAYYINSKGEKKYGRLSKPAKVKLR